MSCAHCESIDWTAYLAEPGDPRWSHFRAHFPSCGECSTELARWTKLEELITKAAGDEGFQHPSEEELLAFQSTPELLLASGAQSIADHVSACVLCRDSLAALEHFDFSEHRPETVENSPHSEEEKGVFTYFKTLFGEVRDLMVGPKIHYGETYAANTISTRAASIESPRSFSLVEKTADEPSSAQAGPVVVPSYRRAAILVSLVCFILGVAVGFLIG